MRQFADDGRYDVLFGSNEKTMGRPFPQGGNGVLYARGPGNIAALAAAIGDGVRPKIFLSIRPQHEFLESFYLQTIHEGRHRPFDAWLSAVDLNALSWRPVVDALHAQGHRALAVTLTGVGERVHLMSSLITLETHIDDVANTLEAEELRDVVLAVHSYAGMIGTAIADRMPERLKHLVYVDAVVPKPGESWSGPDRAPSSARLFLCYGRSTVFWGGCIKSKRIAKMRRGNLPAPAGCCRRWPPMFGMRDCEPVSFTPRWKPFPEKERFPGVRARPSNLGVSPLVSVRWRVSYHRGNRTARSPTPCS